MYLLLLVIVFYILMLTYRALKSVFLIFYWLAYDLIKCKQYIKPGLSSKKIVKKITKEAVISVRSTLYCEMKGSHREH